MDSQFDIFEWHGQFQSCVRYFLDHAQHTGPVQAVAAFLNIQLPYQQSPPISSSVKSGTPPANYSFRPMQPSGFPGMAGPGPASMGSSSKTPASFLGGEAQQQQQQQQVSVTLTPYIRRLVATGFDIPGVLHGFFGDDWVEGVGPLHEAERRNYLFAAKSDNWAKVKASYDMDGNQMVPFLKPLQNVTEKEIVGAEASWSEWLAMQDWMLGPRAPVDAEGREAPSARDQGPQGPKVRIKMEDQ